MSRERVTLYDTTLRDGAQTTGVDFSLEDKRQIAALLDAAQDLGAGAWARFWRITFPLSLPGVYAGAALVFIPALGIFAIPDILGGTDGILIGNLIKQQFYDARDWPFGAALGITFVAVFAACYALLRRAGRTREGAA